MKWGKFCRIINLIWCILFTTLWIGSMVYYHNLFANEAILVLGNMWLGYYFWQTGTIARAKGEIKDKTMFSWKVKSDTKN